MTGDPFGLGRQPRRMRLDPAQAARLDQATAAARDVVAPAGGDLVDSRDMLLTVVVDAEGSARFSTTATTDRPGGGSCPDYRWAADALRALAATCDEAADAARLPR